MSIEPKEGNDKKAAKVFYEALQTGKVIRCEFCDMLHDKDVLISVMRGLNPVTFFCESCHRGAIDILRNESYDGIRL